MPDFIETGEVAVWCSVTGKPLRQLHRYRSCCGFRPRPVVDERREDLVHRLLLLVRGCPWLHRRSPVAAPLV
nr:hypothetical protein Itr_chr06CG17610 [Ipomoea trifida]